MLNKVFLAGRICKDPELKYGQNGKAILKFLMAIEGKDKTTLWINCVVFNEKTIEIFADRMAKGVSVAATGRLEPRTYQDKMYFDLNVDMYGLEVFSEKTESRPAVDPTDYSKLRKKPAVDRFDIDDIPF